MSTNNSPTNTPIENVKYIITQPDGTTTASAQHQPDPPSITRTTISTASTTPDTLSRQISSQLNISNNSSNRSSAQYSARSSFNGNDPYISSHTLSIHAQEPTLHRIHSSPHVTDAVQSNAIQSTSSMRASPLIPNSSQPNTNLYMTGLPITWTKQTLDTYFAVYGRILESRILHDRYIGMSRGIGFVRFANVQSCYAVIATQHGQLLPGSQQILNIRFANENQNRRSSTPVQPSLQSSSASSSATPSQSITPVQYNDTELSQSSASSSINSLLNQTRAAHHRNTSISFSLPLHATPSSTNSLAPSPRGISLFCFHIPPYMTDNDLALLFAQYGRVLNASIMRDPVNNTSRGFGFVSVIDMDVAENCISHLNGYAIAGKFLKVGLKKNSLQSQHNLAQNIHTSITQSEYAHRLQSPSPSYDQSANDTHKNIQ